MNQIKKSSVPRSVKSWAMANILIEKDLVSDFFLWRYLHPNIKSMYRAASLYLLNKKIRFSVPEKFFKVNLDSLEEYWLKG